VGRADGEVGRADGEVGRVDGEVGRVDGEVGRADGAIEKSCGINTHALHWPHNTERIFKNGSPPTFFSALVPAILHSEGLVKQSLLSGSTAEQPFSAASLIRGVINSFSLSNLLMSYDKLQACETAQRQYPDVEREGKGRKVD
jgi:hypothetical protein